MAASLSHRVAKRGGDLTVFPSSSGNEWLPWSRVVSAATGPASGPLSPRGLLLLREQLSGRDLAILGQVSDLRLMTARQIEAIHFPLTEHDSARGAARARQRVLERLTRQGLLSRLERRIGGVRAGSAAFVYALGPTGQRVLMPDGARRRYYEPTERFLRPHPGDRAARGRPDDRLPARSA